MRANETNLLYDPLQNSMGVGWGIFSSTELNQWLHKHHLYDMKCALSCNKQMSFV